MPIDTVQIRIKNAESVLASWNKRYWDDLSRGEKRPKWDDLYLPGTDETPDSRFQTWLLDYRKWDKHQECTGAKLMYIPELSKLILNFSGKTLGKEYLKGLSLETIGLAIENINAVLGGAAHLHVDELIDSAVVESVDNTINVNVDQVDVLPVIQTIKRYSKWDKKKKDNRFDTTAKLYSKAEEFSIYYKNTEIADDPIGKIINLDGHKMRIEHRAKNKASYERLYNNIVSIVKNEGYKDSVKDIPFTYALNNNNSARLIKRRYEKIEYDFNPVNDDLFFNAGLIYNRVLHEERKTLVGSLGHYGVYQRFNYDEAALINAIKEKHRLKGTSRQACNKEIKLYTDAIKAELKKDENFNPEELINKFNEIVFKELERLAV